MLRANYWTIMICAQHKFISLAIHPWMLILTHPFLTQISALLHPPRNSKNYFFKVSIFSSAQLLLFTRIYLLSFFPLLIFLRALYLCLFFNFYLLFFYFCFSSLSFSLTQVPQVIHYTCSLYF